jgi:hypothetical protein
MSASRGGLLPLRKIEIGQTALGVGMNWTSNTPCGGLVKWSVVALRLFAIHRIEFSHPWYPCDPWLNCIGFESSICGRVSVGRDIPGKKSCEDHARPRTV